MDAQLRFKVDTHPIEDSLAGKGDAVVEALIARTTEINRALEDKIKIRLSDGSTVKTHTGKLANSVRRIPTEIDGNKITGGVAAGGGPAYYAKFLEDGTRGPYTILPKDPKGVLAFIVGGKEVFAKKVTHPGLKAYLFMKGTLQEERGDIVEQYREAIREVLK